jgi:hypothetical protein
MVPRRFFDNFEFPFAVYNLFVSASEVFCDRDPLALKVFDFGCFFLKFLGKGSILFFENLSLSDGLTVSWRVSGWNV